MLIEAPPEDVFPPLSIWMLSVVVWGRQPLEQRTLDGCRIASLVLPILFTSTMFPR